MSSEDDSPTVSISKGCFLFKGEQEVKSRKKGRQSASGVSCDDAHMLVPACAFESSAERQRRVDMMKTCWSAFQVRIDEIQAKLHDEITSSLVKFVRQSYSCSRMGGNDVALREIPTAALLTGVNLPDHGVVFKELEMKIRNNVTPFVSRIQPADCSNFRAMVRTALDNFLPSFDGEALNNFNDECNSDSAVEDMPKKSGSPFHDYTFQEFTKWYELQSADVVASDGYIPAVVFVLEGFESFSLQVLQDFILCCAEYLHEIPIVLLLGVATTLAAVHRTLPHAVSTKLAIQVFQSHPPLTCLTDIIDQVFITEQATFKLGPKVSRLLYEQFLYHDFSIRNFVSSVKFSVMQHFYSNPLSILCHHSEEEMRLFFSSCTMERLLQFAHIPSVAAYVDTKSQEEQKKLKSDVRYAKDAYVSLVLDLWKTEAAFYPVMKCLLSVLSKLPKYPLGKRLRDLYETCMDRKRVAKDKAYDSVIAMMRLLSRDELVSCLRVSLEIFTRAMSSNSRLDLNKEVAALKEFCDSVECFDEKADESEVLTKAAPAKPVAVFKSRHEFSERLKASVKEQRRESPYEKVRGEIVDCLDSIFKKHLVSPLSLPFHEIYYYNDYAFVKQRINGVPRMALQNALQRPWSYLRCSCCSADVEGIQSTLPDICILYQLHLECGRLINLYDWLQAFVAIVNPKEAASAKKRKPGKKSSADKVKLDDQLQARFIRGVSELQFMGFIKPTRRKTDHVQRLTWQGC